MAGGSGLTMRQFIEGMTLVFNPKASAGLEAVVQFLVEDEKPGEYYLEITGGDCLFHLGRHPAPTLTVKTPAHVWLAVSSGEMSGPEALIQGKYRVEGDAGLLLRFKDLFPPKRPDFLDAPPGQRPPGPIPLSGMTWMTVAFAPFIFFWIAFETAPLRTAMIWPSIFALVLVLYRTRFGGLTFLETGALGFFVLAGSMGLAGVHEFGRWGSVFSSVYMGALWLGSIVLRDMPLSGEYSKWAFTPKLWRTGLFKHPNAVITLMWGWQFQIAALLALAALLYPDYNTPLTTARYLLLIPAFIFTARYQKGSAVRNIPDLDRSMVRLKMWAVLGLVAAAAIWVWSIWVL
jgi:putative sterol carrier protein